MLTKLFAALMTVIVCTGGIAIAATVPEKDSTAIHSTSEQTMLEATRAEDIALEAAGLTRGQVRFDRTELDRERGVQVWEVEFDHGYAEYDFVIDAVTGEILFQKEDREDDPKPPVPPADTPAEPSAELTEAQALEIALNHAALSAEQVTHVKVQKDFDDGMWTYEIEFRDGGMEYEYEIRISNGKILDWDKEWDD